MYAEYTQLQLTFLTAYVTIGKTGSKLWEIFSKSIFVGLYLHVNVNRTPINVSNNLLFNVLLLY